MRPVWIALVLACSVFTGCAYGIAEPVRFLAHDSARVDGSLYSSRTSGQTFNYWFEYGTTTDYGTRFGHSSVPFNLPNDRFDIETKLTGLDPGTTYHYRLCAIDDDNLNTPGCVGDQTFTTPTTTGPVITLVPDCLDPSGHQVDGLDVTGTGFPQSPIPADPPAIGFEVRRDGGQVGFLGAVRAERNGDVAFGGGWYPQRAIDYFDAISWVDTTFNGQHDASEPIVARGHLDETCDD
jgi:hypothetical protein